MTVSSDTVYDCIVLSGGGAKGAYGAGAAKALAAYRLLKHIENPICFFGASAGALNAAVLAADGADALITLWRSMTNYKVLGVHIKSAKFQGSKHWLGGMLRRQPFYVYSSAALFRLIQGHTDFSRLSNAHLVIAATNYTEGSLKAFYCSSILGQAAAEDSLRPESERRLGHLRPLTEPIFHKCLLASASIPVFFPPVQIDDGGSSDFYIDGGVGNNTPTREAAYFLRYLEESGTGKAGEVYCVMLEPPGTRQEGPTERSLLGIVDRTLSIYHHIHTKPIIHAWYRINEEVKNYNLRLELFLDWVGQQQWGPPIVQMISAQAKAELSGLGGSVPRINVSLHKVEPSSPLGETLDFQPTAIDKNIRTGYGDMLKLLGATNKLDPSELARLQNAPILG
jgi:patatin-like phospholipase